MIPAFRPDTAWSRRHAGCAGFGRAPGRFAGCAAKSRPALRSDLSDAGSGIASTTLNIGAGTPTFTRATVAWTKLRNGSWASVASGSPRYCYLGADTTGASSSRGQKLQLTGRASSTATSPSSASLNITTGILDVDCVLSMADWTPAGYVDLIGRCDALQATGWLLHIDTGGAGIPSLQLYDDSAVFLDFAASVAPVIADGATLGIRAVANVNANPCTCTFYTSTDNGVTWTQLGAVQSLAGLGIDDAAEQLSIGSVDGTTELLDGSVYRARVYNGNRDSGGTLVADFNPGVTTQGDTSFVATTGETWTINGTALIIGISAAGGYFAEIAGTQLVTPTAAIRDMTNAAWVPTNVTPAKTATGIDGVANSASTLTATANGGTILQTLVAAASSRTYSAFVRRKTGTGTISIQQGATTLDITALINTRTYTRVALNASVLNVAFGFIFATSGDAIEVDFNQFEARTFATSPMAAAGAARNADVLTYTFAGNASTAAGTIYADVCSEWATAPSSPIIVSFGAATPLYTNTAAASTVNRIDDGGTNTLDKTGLSSMATARRRRASSWGSVGMLITGDGLAPASGAFDGAMTNTIISVGATSAGAASFNGTIANLEIHTNQHSGLLMQAKTA